MKKFVVANWKMNPQTYGEAERILKSVLEYGGRDLVICPPYPWLTDFSHKHQEVSWGAQDVFYEKEGAYTGEVSVGMLKDAGVEYVIAGHSERRALGDTDEIVNKKIKAILHGGMRPILCVGESGVLRNRGLPAVMAFIKNQIQKDFRNIPNMNRNISRIIIAYEPLWAVNTGRTDKPEDAGEIITFIKHFVSANYEVPIASITALYGGSLTLEKAKGFFGIPQIDGALLGRTSLKPAEFAKIVEIART